jgi:hypothetical protein
MQEFKIKNNILRKSNYLILTKKKKWAQKRISQLLQINLKIKNTKTFRMIVIQMRDFQKKFIKINT